MQKIHCLIIPSANVVKFVILDRGTHWHKVENLLIKLESFLGRMVNALNCKIIVATRNAGSLRIILNGLPKNINLIFGPSGSGILKF